MTTEKYSLIKHLEARRRRREGKPPETEQERILDALDWGKKEQPSERQRITLSAQAPVARKKS